MIFPILSNFAIGGSTDFDGCNFFRSFHIPVCENFPSQLRVLMNSSTIFTFLSEQSAWILLSIDSSLTFNWFRDFSSLHVCANILSLLFALRRRSTSVSFGLPRILHFLKHFWIVCFRHLWNFCACISISQNSALQHWWRMPHGWAHLLFPLKWNQK